MATTRSSGPIVLAAGGTGGHIFPAEAFAEEAARRREKALLITDKRFAGYQGAFKDIETFTIHSGTVLRGLKSKIMGPASIALGIVQAYFLLRRLKPRVVIGFGGYPSFPTVYAATKLGIPTVIHEQNAVLGRANRLLAGKVSRIATSFPTTLMVEERDISKIAVTGNPVRAAIRALHHVPYPSLSLDGKMNILVTGGSQGASVFSKILPEALEALPPSLRARIRLDQQCREADLEATREAYERIGVNANLSHFFTDIPSKLASAHLVIARSGASTVAELAASGRPAILVPYPQAMDNHQYVNANAFEDAGGGWVIGQEGFTAASVAARLEAFLSFPATLAKAAENARTMGRIHAASELADLAFDVARGESAALLSPVSTSQAKAVRV